MKCFTKHVVRACSQLGCCAGELGMPMVDYATVPAANGKTKSLLRLCWLAILAALVMCALAPAPALAEEESESTNDMILEYVPITGAATTENLPNGQVQVTVTSTNGTGSTLPGHMVEFKTPDGWELVSGSLKSGVANTEDGAAVSTTAVFQKATGDGSGGDSSKKKSNSKDGLPSTGDMLDHAGIILVCAVAGALLILMARKLRFKGMMLIVVTVALVASNYPMPVLKAVAEEVSATQGEQESETEGGTDTVFTQPVTATDTLELAAGDETLNVQATLTFLAAAEHEDTGVVNVDTSKTIEKTATSAFIKLESSTPFARTKSLSAKETEQAVRNLSVDAADDLSADGKFADLDAGEFDASLLTFSSALEGVTVRGNPIVLKTDDTDDFAENSIEGDDKTHYEMWLAVDGIDTSKISEDDETDYGYIDFAAGSFAESDEADENYTGTACVAFVDVDANIPEMNSKTDPIGSDTKVHTFDNGEFWDGKSSFKIAVDLGGLCPGMPVRDDAYGYDSLAAEPYQIEGCGDHYFKTPTDADILNNIILDGVTDASVTATDYDLSDQNLWVTFTVEGKTGEDAYSSFTSAISKGVRIGRVLTATTYDIRAYPVGVDPNTETGDDVDGFGYAESNPLALVWASGYKTSGSNTVITYLASVQGTADIMGTDDADAEVNLTKETELEASLPEGSTDDGTSGEEGISLASDSGDESGDGADSGATIKDVKVKDAKKNVIELTVSVPTDEFNESLSALGLDDASEAEKLESLYSYISGAKLLMTNGSSNTFGISSADEYVRLVDGAALESNLSGGAVATASGSGSDLVNPETVKEKTSGIADKVNELVTDDLKTAAKESISTGKEIYAAISDMIQAIKENGELLTTANLSSVASIIGSAVTLISKLMPTDYVKTYTTGDIMNKLNELEQTVNAISTNTSLLTLGLAELDSTFSYQKSEATLTALNSYFAGKEMSDLISNLQEELAKKTDKNGNACTLATPIADMPEDAIKLVRKFVAYGNKYAKLQTGCDSAQAALYQLDQMIQGGSAALSGNLLDAYFNYTKNFFNWESETYTARLSFLATLTQMWMNGYIIANADLSLQAYDARDKDELDKKAIKSQIDSLVDRMDKSMQKMYGSYDWNQLAKDCPNDATTSEAVTTADEEAAQSEDAAAVEADASEATDGAEDAGDSKGAGADEADTSADGTEGDEASEDDSKSADDSASDDAEAEASTQDADGEETGETESAALEAAQSASDNDQQTTYKHAYDPAKLKAKYASEFAKYKAQRQKEVKDESEAERLAVQDLIDAHYFTESAIAKRTHSDGSKNETLLVADDKSRTVFSPSYGSSSRYARTAAYDKTCFALSYTHEIYDDLFSSANSIMKYAKNSSWSPSSSFEAWQIKQMVKRLNALPAALRPVITTTDSDGKEVTRAVKNIDEELQTLGWKTINTSPEKNYQLKYVGQDSSTPARHSILDISNDNTSMSYKLYTVVDKGTSSNPTATSDEKALDRKADENQTWPFIMTDIGYNLVYSVAKHGSFSSYEGCIRTSLWTELGSSQRLLGTNIGTRITDSNKWVVTSCDSVTQMSGREKDCNYHNATRYGTVVNYETGDIRQNQFLYTFDTEFYAHLYKWYDTGNWLTQLWCSMMDYTWINRAEFYAFGVYNLDGTSATIETGEWNGNMANTDENIFAWRHLNVFYRNDQSPELIKSWMENTYWTPDTEGHLYVTENGVLKKGEKRQPQTTYKYK